MGAENIYTLHAVKVYIPAVAAQYLLHTQCIPQQHESDADESAALRIYGLVFFLPLLLSLFGITSPPPDQFALVYTSLVQ